MRTIKVLALTLAFVSLVWAQSEDAALTAIVGKYFDAYARKDWAAMQAIWQVSSPGLGQRFEILPKQFADSELRFSTPQISRIKIDGDTASLRVSTRRTSKNGDVNSMTEMRVEMAFVREAGQWKLWSEISPLTALLNSLTEAKNDEERRRLLDQENDLVSRDLLFMLAGQSDRAYAQGNQARSLSILQSQILVAEQLGNRSELSDAWHKVGIIHFLQKRFADALAAYRKSLTIDEEAGRQEESARSMSSIGLVFLSQSKFAESFDHFQRALSIYESLNRKTEAVRTIENMGNVRNEQGEYAAAIELYQRCVQLYDETKRANEAAHMVLKIARVEYEQGRDATAIGWFRQAADRFIAAGNRRTLGYAYHNLANILYEQGDYNQALIFYQRSLQAEREAGTREGESGALQGIGLVHSLNGSYGQALDAYQQNLAVVRALGNKTDLAAALQKVGGANFSWGKWDDALASYKEALDVRERIGENQEIAMALLDVGLTLAAKQDYEGALEQYSRSRQIFEMVGNSSGVAAALLNTAQTHYLQRDFSKTIEVAQQAAEVAKKANDQDIFWQARHRAGKAYFRLNDLGSARKALTEAISTIETMRPQASRGQQPRFFEAKIAPYQAMVDVAIGEGQGNDAYNFSQRAKIRVLTGLLQNVKTQITKTMTAREQERERQFLDEINRFNLQMYREQEREKPNQSRAAELKATLQKAQTDYAAFRTQLFTLHPALKTLRGEIKPATVETAVNLVRDTKTALLEYVETDEKVYLFVFVKDQAKTGKRPVPAALRIIILDTSRGDLYPRLVNFNQLIANRDEAVNAQAHELYDILLKPAQEALTSKTHVMIAPDAITWGIPFQALKNDAGRYLIEDHAIRYTPSLTILNAMASTRLTAPAANRRTQLLDLLAVINPTLAEDSRERIKTAMAIKQVDPLTDTDKEITELGKLYTPTQAAILSGMDASEDKVKSEIGRARVIQFATRGIHHEASPMFSFLAFAQTAEGVSTTAKEDGFLELRELLKLNLRAEQIVLESSEWAQPKTLTNRAMTAWTWAWFVAGGQSVLVSQWRTDSSDLLIEFHRQLKNSTQSKSAGWQEAVRQILRREEFKHPYYWAGFNMLGR